MPLAKWFAMSAPHRPLSRSELLSGSLVVVDRDRRNDSQAIVLAERAPGQPMLSPREHRVLEWVARGEPLKVAAIDLGLPESTTRSHFVRARQKLGFADREELVFWSTSLTSGEVATETHPKGIRLRADVARVDASCSEAEQHIAALVSCGLSNADIARMRGVSPKTIQNQLLAVYRKLHLGSRFELAQRCASPPRRARAGD
jgi:DNA-binding NarL/FixJ family response regulator